MGKKGPRLVDLFHRGGVEEDPWFSGEEKSERGSRGERR